MVFGHRFQAVDDIDGWADSGERLPAAGADIAVSELSTVDAEPDGQRFGADIQEVFVDVIDPPPELRGRQKGRRCRCGRIMRPENRQDSVARIAQNFAAIRLDGTRGAFQKAVQQGQIALHPQALDPAGRVAQVGVPGNRVDGFEIAAFDMPAQHLPPGDIAQIGARDVQGDLLTDGVFAGDGQAADQMLERFDMAIGKSARPVCHP